MFVDHIFIFTDDQGQVADSLLDLGFIEGSNRVHDGQGTSNRKFYFDNFFLEIIWVHDKQQIISENTSPMGLWQRANYKNSGFSPYGLCLVNNETTDNLFNDAFAYQPAYFPENMPIAIIKNEQQGTLPYTFRLPFRQHRPQQKNQDEPKQVFLDIHQLTKVTFEYTDVSSDNSESSFVSHFNDDTYIEFINSDRYWLTLTFDDKKSGQSQHINKLCLTINY